MEEAMRRWIYVVLLILPLLVPACGGGGGGGGDTSATYFADADDDSFGDVGSFQVLESAQAGWVLDSTDCDDSSDTVYPGAAELCNSIDDDCDGTADDSCGEVDTSSRSEVTLYYDTYYADAFSTTKSWSGSTGSCTAGSISQAYRDEVLQVFNFYRAMTGLPWDVTYDTVMDDSAQDLALMMDSNSRYSPYWGADEFDNSRTCSASNDYWSCYTQDGCESGIKSNLYWNTGEYSAGNIVEAFISDQGNAATLGHRRWMLYPPLVEVGLGATDDYAALNVLGSWGTRPASPEWVAWPPAGYVPHQIVYDVWSFSAPTPAYFSAATVAVTKDGLTVPVTSAVLFLGYGDPVISWEFGSAPAFSDGMSDMAYTVTVGGITGMSQSSYTYNVTVFDPDSP